MLMNSITKESEKRFWLEFIDLYRQLPELWQTKNELYRNRHRKAAAYKKLARKLKEININADRLYIIRKINNMRSSYRRELHKLKKRQQCGDYTHVPNLWYFESMEFLRNQEGSNEEHHEEKLENEDSQVIKGSRMTNLKLPLNHEAKKNMQMNSVVREGERKFWLEFIEMYKNLPELWQKKNEVYKDRHRKAAAYKKLVRKLKEVNINADRLFVTRKINNLRSSYRRELNKLKKRQQCGDYMHVPNWWYFESMDFLRNQEGSNEEHHEEKQENEESQMEDILDEISMQKEDEEIEEYDILGTDEKPEIYIKERSEDRSRTRNRARQTTVFKQDQNTSIDSDKTDIYGRCWAAEYSKLDPEQQIYAKRAIDEVLFQGRLGNLTIESTEIPILRE